MPVSRKGPKGASSKKWGAKRLMVRRVPRGLSAADIVQRVFTKVQWVTNSVSSGVIVTPNMNPSGTPFGISTSNTGYLNCTIGFLLAASYTHGQWPEASSYTALYDYSSIVKIEHMFDFVNNNSTTIANDQATGKTSGGPIPPLTICADYDDASATLPATSSGVSGLLQWACVKQHRFDASSKPYKYTLSTRVAIQTFVGAGTAYIVPKAGQWVNWNTAIGTGSNCPHYGCKAYIEDWPLSNASADVALKISTR
jgi:hypothetical protein